MFDPGRNGHRPDDKTAVFLNLCAAHVPQNAEFSRFCEALFRNAAAEDIAGYAPAEMLALAQAAFARAAAAPPGESRVELFDPAAERKDFSHRSTVLVAVNDDSPFLFDSVVNEITAEGLRLDAAFHPIVEMAGRRASIVVLVLEYIADEQRRAALKGAVTAVLSAVHAAVEAWQPMRARLAEAVGWLHADPPAIDREELAESIAFLEWLGEGHFTFLGTRDYAYFSEGGGRLEPMADSGLGLLANRERHVVRRDPEDGRLSAPVHEFLTLPAPVIIAKSNGKSPVHRRVQMDYVGVKSHGPGGALKGERRFVGLFTSGAYNLRPFDIPLVRLKAKNVMARAGFPPASHDEKALAHIIDTFPRDELFQIGEDELFAAAMGILKLGERPQVRLFPRFDRFGRFVTAIVFVPRDRYGTDTCEKIHAILARRYGGRTTAARPILDDSPLARIYYIVGRGGAPLAAPDTAAVEAEIRRAVRTWEDGFGEALAARYGADDGERRRRERAGGIPAAYRDAFSPHEAAEDIARLEDLAAGADALAARVWRKPDDAPTVLRMKLYGLGAALPLSQSLPVFEHFGLKVIAENAYPLALREATAERPAFVLDFLMERDGAPALADIRRPLEEAVRAAIAGKNESDGFDRLVPCAGLSAREVTILRAAAKFLRQAAIPFSQSYMEQALARNPAIARMLVDLFHARCDPDRADEAAASAIFQKIETALAAVPSLDDDRIVRRLRNVIAAILRTNYYQPDETGAPKPYLSFKLDSPKLDGLPAPKPMAEIFVYAPEVEGVHLRFGKVARGGLRWSDRREDFRTEILGLVKAQQVKNAVIVPVGSKGGFYPKKLPAGGAREDIQAAGIAAYRTFIDGLLDLTDNLDPAGKVIPPARVVRHDGDDPYLVVAADKGTASFSDTANAIAIARGFWLGDAFASGGSHGYDHKKMGITAKGAWEAVKRHFREIGRDIQKEPFTCIGVGDMSGDVFGNAMLLSPATRLLAAFDHRHIFLDPDPDPERSWAERKRLFDLPRSSWADYDKNLISAGGGVFARSAKAIPLSAETKALTGLLADAAAPDELVAALLKAPADLLFFGGIGTFVKASRQSHAEVGDRANDAVRIDAGDLKAKVVGEGANLGLTQAGRIEAAANGVRLNTDAIDNSAGVDTSDHEVNLKILIGGPMRRGEIDAAERDRLLHAMTETVAAQVLQDNIDQTLALSVAESRAPADIDAAGRFMRELERRGELNRKVETLPDDAELARRARKGLGLTRPELAVLLAYAKLDLKRTVLETSLPDDPYLQADLIAYFPPEAAERFGDELPRHRLKREIVASVAVNRLVNLAGPLAAMRLEEISGETAERAVRGLLVAEAAFGLDGLKARIDALDGRMDPSVHIAMVDAVGETLGRLGLWFAVNVPEGASFGGTVDLYRQGAEALGGTFSGLVSPVEAADTEARIARFAAAGAPADVAAETGALPLLTAAPEIVLLAKLRSLDIDMVAGAFFAAGKAAGIDRLKVAAGGIVAAEHWDRLAVRRLTDELSGAQRRLAAAALTLHPSGKGRGDGVAAVTKWAEKKAAPLARAAAFLSALERSGALTVAKLTLACGLVREICSGPG